jgi:hypothetical protein
MDINNGEESSDSDCEFELLVINKDEQFVEENGCLFMAMKDIERHYLEP